MREYEVSGYDGRRGRGRRARPSGLARRVESRTRASTAGVPGYTNKNDFNEVSRDTQTHSTQACRRTEGAAGGHGAAAHRSAHTTHVPRYPQSTVTLLRMRQVVDTTSLRPGPPAPPQCREWRRSLVSLPHEPPTSDLHASLAATHTHAQQPPISITRTRHSLGSVRCPPTRLPHGQRDAISSHSPHPTFAEPKRAWYALERASSHRASNDAVQGVAARTPPPMPSRAAIHPCVRCLLRLGEGSEARAEG